MFGPKRSEMLNVTLSLSLSVMYVERLMTVGVSSAIVWFGTFVETFGAVLRITMSSAVVNLSYVVPVQVTFHATFCVVVTEIFHSYSSDDALNVMLNGPDDEMLKLMLHKPPSVLLIACPSVLFV